MTTQVLALAYVLLAYAFTGSAFSYFRFRGMQLLPAVTLAVACGALWPVCVFVALWLV